MKHFFLIFIFTFLAWLARFDFFIAQAASALDEALKFYENQEYAKAFDLFDTLCEKNAATSCFSLAYMYENAQGVSQNEDKAAEFYKKSCDLKLAKACANLGFLLHRNEKKDEAMLSFNEACKLNDPASCAIIAQLFENSKDGLTAAAFYKSACELKDPGSCYKLGSLYHKGEIVREDERRAMDAYARACDLGLGAACFELGKYNEEVKKDAISAKKFYGLACDMQDTNGCEAYKKIKNSQTQN